MMKFMPPDSNQRVAQGPQHPGPRESGTHMWSGAADSLLSRELESADDFRAAGELYTRVFQYRRDEFTLNPNLLSALVQNGGSAVGVFLKRGELIGFSYGFAARDRSGIDFHYSQATTVDPGFQGRGVGRLLKLQQAAVATRWGHQTMRWTFDPALARNAHFNFDSLGAIGVGFLPSYYARPDSDRILVEWTLGGRPSHRVSDRGVKSRVASVPALSVEDWGMACEEDGNHWIAVPAVPIADKKESAQIKSRINAVLQRTFASGRVLIGCSRLNDDTAAYLAVPGTGKES